MSEDFPSGLFNLPLWDAAYFAEYEKIKTAILSQPIHFIHTTS